MFNPTLDKRIGKRKLDRIVSELQSDKLFLTCGKHQYVAYHKPHSAAVLPPQPRGCPDCWKAYFFTIHALTTPELRYEHLQELDEVIRKTAEMERKGKFDLQLDEKPEVRFHKDAADDNTGEERVTLTDMEIVN